MPERESQAMSGAHTSDLIGVVAILTTAAVAVAIAAGL